MAPACSGHANPRKNARVFVFHICAQPGLGSLVAKGVNPFSFLLHLSDDATSRCAQPLGGGGGHENGGA